jgi:hypothetical protein
LNYRHEPPAPASIQCFICFSVHGYMRYLLILAHCFQLGYLFSYRGIWRVLYSASAPGKALCGRFSLSHEIISVLLHLLSEEPNSNFFSCWIQICLFVFLGHCIY